MEILPWDSKGHRDPGDHGPYLSPCISYHTMVPIFPVGVSCPLQPLSFKKQTSLIVYIYPQSQRDTCQASHEFFHIFLPGGRNKKELAHLVAQRVKNLPVNVGDLGLNPGLGRSSGGGHSNSLQYSCLQKPMDSGAWGATVHRVTKSQNDWSDLPCMDGSKSSVRI